MKQPEVPVRICEGVQAEVGLQLYYSGTILAGLAVRVGKGMMMPAWPYVLDEECAACKDADRMRIVESDDV